jgi:hypothetical protein
MQKLLERLIIWVAERLDGNLVVVPDLEEP